MNVIGFSFTKIAGERSSVLKQTPTVNTNIEFSSVEKENLPFLTDKESLKFSFKFSVTYTNPEDNPEGKKVNNSEKSEKNKSENKAENKLGNQSIAGIFLEGNVILTAEKNEVKDVLKKWKKNDLPDKAKIPLYNYILRKCSPKVIQLEDELGLPFHIPIPQIQPKNSQE